jgi:hypothetical protein
MPRMLTPEGYITSAQAAKILNCSVSMVYNYERSGQLHKKTPPGKKQGFFIEEEVKALAEGLTAFFDRPATSKETEKDELVFSQATPEDMEGVYKVAASLFGSTTPAEARKLLIKQCPEGNYIVKRNNKVVAYIHIQPLKHEKLVAFMKGEIRGKDITKDDLDCFEEGKTVECLIKSIGATKQIGTTDENKRANQLRFLFRLLKGTALEIAKLGSKGVIISKIYATSETVTGIAMGFGAKMEQFGKPLGEGRFRFVMDIDKSEIPLVQPYKKALSDWKSKQQTSTN